MNRKPFARTLAVALLLLISALAGAAAPTGSRYPLRHRVAVGDRHVWDSVSVASLKLTARSGDQEAPPIESTTRFRQKLLEEVLAVRGSTVTKLRQRFLVARDIATDPDGNQSIETSSLQGKTFTIERKGGKVVISPASSKISIADRKQLSQALEQAYLSLLPNREAPVGEEWTITAKQVQILFPQARAGTLQARFQEVIPYAGRRCAHIRLSGELELAIDGLPAPARTLLTGDLYHALDLQRPVALEFAGPLTVDAQIEQEGRTISLTGEGRMTAKVTMQWQKASGKPVAAPKATPKPAVAPQPPAKPRPLRYGDVSFQLPGPGWKVIRYDPEARRIELGRQREGGMRGVSIWPVEVPPAERDRSLKEHAAAYFEFERGLERPDGPWTGFKEGERPIGGRRYPTMTFQFHPNLAAEHVMEGLFLVYFPKDFTERHRFYVLMWADLHLKRAPASSLDELDAVVASLQVF